MKFTPEALWKAILEVGIAKIIELILWLLAATGGTALIAKLLASNSARFVPYRWYFIFILPLPFWLFVMWLYRRFSRFRPQFPRVDCDYVILEHKLHYEYLDDVRILFRKLVRIESLKHGVSAYHDRYIWTGEGERKIDALITGQTVRDTGSVSGWDCYAVDLGRTLKKGEQCEIELLWTLLDSARKAKPFLAVTVREPTKKLELKITLHKPVSSKAIGEVRTNGSVLLPRDTEYIAFDRQNEAVWNPAKPKLLHHYQMRWYE